MVGQKYAKVRNLSFHRSVPSDTSLYCRFVADLRTLTLHHAPRRRRLPAFGTAAFDVAVCQLEKVRRAFLGTHRSERVVPTTWGLSPPISHPRTLGDPWMEHDGTIDPTSCKCIH